MRPRRRRKVCVVVTARPSYSRIRSALTALKARRDATLQLVITASALKDEGGRPDRVMRAEGFQIAARVPSMDPQRGLLGQAYTTANGIRGLADAFAKLRPDVVVTIGDRYETLATAVAAAYCNIPLAHVQGGEITGNIDEKVRHAVTKLADLHLVAFPAAGARVRRMGEPASTIHVTGCPSIDVARVALKKRGLPGDLWKRCFDKDAPRLDLTQGFVVALQHPVTTEHEAAGEQIAATLEAVRRLGLPTLWFGPNVDAGADATARAIRAYRRRHALPSVRFFDNLPPEDFIRVLDRASCIVGNSSVAIREASWMGVPAVNVGSRQRGRDRGKNVVDVGYSPEAILRALRRQRAAGRRPSNKLYGEGDAGRRIARVLATAPLGIAKRFED